MAKVSLDDETADSAFLHGTPLRLKPDAICSNCSRRFPIDSPCLLQVNLEGRSAVETVLRLFSGFAVNIGIHRGLQVLAKHVRPKA